MKSLISSIVEIQHDVTDKIDYETKDSVKEFKLYTFMTIRDDRLYLL